MGREHRQQRHRLTREEAERIHDPVERRFALNALRAGYTVESGRSIQSRRPVRDRFGERKKHKTKADLFLIDEDDSEAHVELTKSTTESASKLAQQRVADAAGVKNYKQLTDGEVEPLDETYDTSRLKNIIRSLLNWK
jgi:hypothetical protein